MELEFQTLDVFSSRCFGGNQLAVVWAPAPLHGQLMQSIAAEFNIAETIFLSPPVNSAHHASARIFTPTAELKFAGHPSVGAAYALAMTNDPYTPLKGNTVLMEQPVGLVTAVMHGAGARVASPQSLETGETVEPALIAQACGLRRDDIVTGNHSPTVASCGVPLIFVELASEEALARAEPDYAVFRKHLPRTLAVGVHLYTRAMAGDVDYAARMFAPNVGIPEDPATGAANLALVALLAQCAAAPEVSLDLKILQGVHMGRPSLMRAQARKTGGQLSELWIGGDCIEVTRGILSVPG